MYLLPYGIIIGLLIGLIFGPIAHLILATFGTVGVGTSLFSFLS